MKCFLKNASIAILISTWNRWTFPVDSNESEVVHIGSKRTVMSFNWSDNFVGQYSWSDNFGSTFSSWSSSLDIDKWERIKSEACTNFCAKYYHILQNAIHDSSNGDYRFCCCRRSNKEHTHFSQSTINSDQTIYLTYGHDAIWRELHFLLFAVNRYC